MIRISCTNCKTILSIDDAFAGGVCRCQHCGTIQTVPAKARDGAVVSTAGQSIGGMKSHYQNSDTGSGTGLDELAGIVVSSGLSSSRLTRKSKSAGSKSKSNLMPIVVAAGVIVIVLVFVIIYLATRSNVSPANQAIKNAAESVSGSAIVKMNSPNFCGTALDGSTVIYLLDCGVATQDFLGELKDATIKSLGTLGTNRKFEILFWNNGTDGAYPENTTAYANQDSITSAQKAIDDVAPFGQTDIQPALKIAIAQHPDVLIIATGKGWELDNAWYDAVMATRGSSPVKIHTFNLGTSGESPPMKKLAGATGGTYHELSKTDLSAFGQ